MLTQSRLQALLRYDPDTGVFGTFKIIEEAQRVRESASFPEIAS